MNAQPDLAALLCSRLCHDLVSPVAAFGNGLELLEHENDPAMRDSCTQLLAQSARAAADKLTFFRYAFGAAGSSVQEMPVAEMRELITALAAGGREVALDWGIAAETLPGPAAKLLLNMAAIGLDTLVRGGVLAIAAERRGSEVEIAIRAEGGRIAMDRDIGRALDGTLPPHQLSARTAPAALVRQLAETHGGAVQQAQGDGVLVMGATIGASAQTHVDDWTDD